jgi:hypothetical protein
MRIANWDSGLHWGDPNLRWGNPAYLLEPGDPGYVADPTSASFPVSKPSKKRKQMPKGDRIKRTERDLSNQMLQFRDAIGTYATLLNVSAGQISAQAADAVRYKWELDVASQCAQTSQQWTVWKQITRDGGAFPSVGAPVELAWPSPEPPAVAPGVEGRFRELVQHCANHPNCNPGIEAALGIEASEISGPDFGTFGPLLKLKVDASGVLVGWGWQGFRAFLGSCEIHVDRGDGQGFKMLTIDTTPNYLDTHALPATPTKWTYKAVYRLGDTRVGQWSAPVSVNVG